MAYETNEGGSLVVTEAELAKRTGIPGPTWRYWRHKGEGPPYIRPSTRSVRYRVTDVERWLEARTVHPGGSG